MEASLFGLLLLVAGLIGLVILIGGVVALVMWVFDRRVGRRGDRAARALARRLERGEITPAEYREGIDVIEGGAPSARDR
jgi:uncharacterized membrane protein